MTTSRSRKPQSMVLLEQFQKKARKATFSVGDQDLVMYCGFFTPELAAAIIEHANLRNRSVRQNKVLEYARYMKQGHWLLRNPLVFTDHGELIDGQHRLLAIVESGTAQPFLVHVIPSKRAQEENRYLDIGVPRNLVDYLHFNGVPDAARAAPLLVLERNARVSGSPLQAAKWEKPDILALYGEIGDEELKKAYDIVPRGLHKTLDIRRPFLDWFAYHARQVDEGGAQVFFGCLHDPSQLRKTDAPYVLREYLIHLQRKQIQASVVQKAHTFAKAWRFYAEGQPATAGKIRHRINEDWPGIFGEGV